MECRSESFASAIIAKPNSSLFIYKDMYMYRGRVGVLARGGMGVSKTSVHFKNENNVHLFFRRNDKRTADPFRHTYGGRPLPYLFWYKKIANYLQKLRSESSVRDSITKTNEISRAAFGRLWKWTEAFQSNEKNKAPSYIKMSWGRILGQDLPGFQIGRRFD